MITPPVVLIGYPGSQKIVPASKYLVDKYLSDSVTYLNYKGPIEGWSKYVAGFLEYLTDENVIFALDDYLLADYIDWSKYGPAEVEIGGDCVCIKLCHSTSEEHLEYPVTTQYCIWNREYLIWLLNQVQTPWQFEIEGSKIFNKVCLHRPCLKYFTNSSLSGRWEGVNLSGLKEEDINYMKENGLL